MNGNGADTNLVLMAGLGAILCMAAKDGEAGADRRGSSNRDCNACDGCSNCKS